MTHLQLKEGEYTATIYGMVCQLHKVSQIILQFDLINLANDSTNVVMTVVSTDSRPNVMTVDLDLLLD